MRDQVLWWLLEHHQVRHMSIARDLELQALLRGRACTLLLGEHQCMTLDVEDLSCLLVRVLRKPSRSVYIPAGKIRYTHDKVAETSRHGKHAGKTKKQMTILLIDEEEDAHSNA